MNYCSKGVKSRIEWPGWLKCAETVGLVMVILGTAMFTKAFV